MIHIFPIGEETLHETKGTQCWCNPDVEWVDPDTREAYREALVIHHSRDHREVVEEAEVILNDGKGD